jgi:hypothetical protein
MENIQYLVVFPHCSLSLYAVCAAPGSKTFQLLEIIYQSTRNTIQGKETIKQNKTNR